MSILDIYISIAHALHQIGVVLILAAGILVWMRQRTRAIIVADSARRVYQALWLCLIMAGAGAVWAHFDGGQVTMMFIDTALQVVIAMALLPAGVMLLHRSGFARAPHMRLDHLSRRPYRDARVLAARRRAVFAAARWRRYPWLALSLWSLFSLVFSVLYLNGVIYIATLPGWESLLGGEPRLSPEIEELLAGQSMQPLLVIGRLLSAAISEEVMFRMVGLGAAAWALRHYTGRERPVLAIVLVSIVFALGHAGFLVQPVWKELHTLGLGLIYGWMVRRYGATASIPAHLILNLIASLESLGV